MQKSDWEVRLDNTALSKEEKGRHRAIIRWFLGYCRNRRPPVSPGRDSANEFDRELRRTRKPTELQLNRWRAGIRWFLGTLGETPISRKRSSEEEGPRSPAWRHTMIGQSRLKHLSYRTEQTYLAWASRFARFLNGRDPMTAMDEDAVEFLSDLAVRKQVAGSTQNQARIFGRYRRLWDITAWKQPRFIFT